MLSPETCHILAAPFTAVNEDEQRDDKSTAGRKRTPTLKDQ